MKKMLIVKTSSLGDVVQALSLVKMLHTYDPRITIDWIAEEKIVPLLRAHSSIRNVFPIQTHLWRRNWFFFRTWREVLQVFSRLRKMRYDYVIDLQGNSKSSLITLFAKSSVKIGFGWRTVPEKINFFVTTHHYDPLPGKNIREDYCSLWQQYAREVNLSQIREYSPLPMQLKILKKEEKAVSQLFEEPLLQNRQLLLFVDPHSRWENKKISYKTWIYLLAKILVLYQTMKKEVAFLFSWGSEEEKKKSQQIQVHFKKNSLLIPPLSLPALHRCISHVDGVIALDSFTLHLSGTASPPTFSIFGPSSAQKYAPFEEEKKHRSFQGECPYEQSFSHRCSLLRTCPQAGCVKNIDPTILWKQLLSFLREIPDSDPSQKRMLSTDSFKRK